MDTTLFNADFNQHKFPRDIRQDSLASLAFWLDKSNTLEQKRAFADKLLTDQTQSATGFPLIRDWQFKDVTVNTHGITVHICVEDDRGNQKELTAPYNFPAINVPELLRDDEKFADALALLVCLQAIVPLSMVECNSAHTFHDYLRQMTVGGHIISLHMNDSVSEACLKKAINRLWKDHGQLVGSQLQKTIAFFAWNDRMSMYRLSFKDARTRQVYFAELDPKFVMEAPVDYTYGQHSELNTYPVAAAYEPSLVSFSWGKESLLSAQIAERINTEKKPVYGIVSHQYGAESQQYQGDYDAFRVGTRYEVGKATFLSSGNGYLNLIYDLIPQLPGVSHAMHHMYAMCHLINSWNEADVILLGDELERNFRNPIYKLVDSDRILSWTMIEDTHKNMGVEIMVPESHDEDIFTDLGVYKHVGYDFGFDFHQSEHMHNMLNELLKQSDLGKCITSLVYNYSEIAIQYLLHSLDKEAFSYQASCWYASDTKATTGSKWCNNCEKCHRLAWVMKALDIPTEQFGLKYVDPLSYLKPHELTGNRVFAITADPHSQGEAYHVCDAAVKFMLMRTVLNDDPTAGHLLPAELNYDAVAWIRDIKANLLLPVFGHSTSQVSDAQMALMAKHIESFNSLVLSHAIAWESML